MSYHQITPAERYTLATLRKQVPAPSTAAIARLMGRHRSTIAREIARNRSRHDGAYRHSQAQERTNGRRSRSRRNSRFDAPTWDLVIGLLREGLSPEQISGRLRLEGRLAISYESIYRFIRRDKKRGGHLFRLLRQPPSGGNATPVPRSVATWPASGTSPSDLPGSSCVRRSATGRWIPSLARPIVTAWSVWSSASPAAFCWASYAPGPSQRRTAASFSWSAPTGTYSKASPSTMEPSFTATATSSEPPAQHSTLPRPTAPGSGARTRTRMGSSDSTSQSGHR